MFTRRSTAALLAATLLVPAAALAQNAKPAPARPGARAGLPLPTNDQRPVAAVPRVKTPAAASALGVPNDDCATPRFVNVPSVTSGTTVGASPDPEAGPACGTTITSPGVWYSVTGTGNTITVTTCPNDDVQPGDADFDTKISVFCGDCASLSCVGGNDGGCGFFFQSTFEWCSEAGVEYLVLVHGKEDQGDFELSIYDDGIACDTPPDCAPPAVGACCFSDFSCLDTSAGACEAAGGVPQEPGTACADFDCTSLLPPNDTCVGAEHVDVPSLTDGSTVFATEEIIIGCGTFIQSPGVWYTVTGTGNTMTVTTCDGDPVQPGGADFDTSLTVFCGSCNASDCCGFNGGLGCDDNACEEAVCAVDPFCCQVQWDDVCAQQALIYCPDLCEPTFCIANSDDDCGTNSLLSTASWCSEPGRTYYVLVHGFDAVGDFELSVYDDGEPCLDPPNCDACVFECPPGALEEDEPNCGIPEDIVNGGCNSPIGGSTCCVGQSTPGCSDPVCMGIICEFDPFCCEEQWDALCAQMALEQCDSCQDLVFPMEPIACGERYCSTAAATVDRRDVDWYKLEVPEDGFVEMTVTAGFPVLYGIVDTGGVDTCEDLEDFVTSTVAQPCETGTLATFLSAGTWYLIVAPAQFTPIACETDYEVSITCSNPGSCCFGDGTCFVRDETVCMEQGGTWLGPDESCFALDGTVASYTSQPFLNIPDGDPNGIVDRQTIDDSIIIGKLTVELDVPHTWLSDLTIELTHEPSGTSAALWRFTCDGGFNLDATFDDDGGPVECGWPSTEGVFTPLDANGTPLSVFTGLDAAGDWALKVTDFVGFESGELRDWTLNIETGPVVECEEPTGRCCPGCPSDCGVTDGLVDMLDLMALIDQWGTPGPCSLYGDEVGFEDLLHLLWKWGECPTECSVTDRASCEAEFGDWLPGADCDSDPCE